MMIVLQFHGVPFGQVVRAKPRLAFGVIMSMVVAYISWIFTILPLARYLAKGTVIRPACWPR